MVLQSLPVLTVLVAIGVAAGQLLATSEEVLLTIPVLLLLVVPINAASGMIGAVLGARVATGLHTGSLLSDGARQFRRDLVATIVLGFIIFGTLAFYGATLARLDGESANLLARLLLVVFGTGGLLVIGMIVLVSILGSLSFRLGWDPDNVVVPSVTTAGDLLGITSFILMVQWVGL